MRRGLCSFHQQTEEKVDNRGRGSSVLSEVSVDFRKFLYTEGAISLHRQLSAVASTRVIGQHDSSTCLRETEAHTKRLHQDAVHLLGYRKTRPEGQR